MKNRVSDEAVARKFISLKMSADARGKEFNLNLTSVRNLLSAKKCYYTGKPLTLGSNFSVDRVDSEKGYVKGNVVACDKDVNMFKDNLPVEDIIKMAKSLQKRVNK